MFDVCLNLGLNTTRNTQNKSYITRWQSLPLGFVAPSRTLNSTKDQKHEECFTKNTWTINLISYTTTTPSNKLQIASKMPLWSHLKCPNGALYYPNRFVRIKALLSRFPLLLLLRLLLLLAPSLLQRRPWEIYRMRFDCELKDKLAMHPWMK